MLTSTVAANKALRTVASGRRSLSPSTGRSSSSSCSTASPNPATTESSSSPSIHVVADKTVAQRKRTSFRRRSCSHRRGLSEGIQGSAEAPIFQEIPQLAQIVSSSVKKIGIDMPIKMLTYTAYYAGTYSGGATGRGTAPWLQPTSILPTGRTGRRPNVPLQLRIRHGWTVECGGLFEQDGRRSDQVLQRGRRARGPEEVHRADHADLAEGHAGDLPDTTSNFVLAGSSRSRASRRIASARSSSARRRSARHD